MAKTTEDKKKAPKVKRPTALKRDDQSEKARLRNRAFKSSVRTSVRHLDEALSTGDANLIRERLSTTYSLMDKGVKRGALKLNTASRTKSRLAARAAAAAK